MQLRELPSDSNHPDRQTAARWWDDLGEEQRYKLFGTDLVFTAAFPEGQTRGHDEFPAPGVYGWGAYDTAGNLAGFVTGKVDGDTPTELGGLVYMTDPDRQGRGIGPEMLRKLIHHETCSSIETFHCTVFATNEYSRKAVTKAGFVLDETSGYFVYLRPTS